MDKHAIKKILVPVDYTETSDAAISKAVSLAKLLKADLFLIHIIEYGGFFYSNVRDLAIALPSEPDLMNMIEGKMDTLKDEINDKYGISPTVYVTSGHVYSNIIEYCENEDIDLIVMGTHGSSGYKEYFIGSNAQRVVHLSDVPVLTLQKDKGTSEFKNILIPIDEGIHSREKVNIAMIFAELFDSKIHILGLIDTKKKIEEDKFRIKCESVEKIVHEEKLPYITTIVHEGDLSTAAMDYADKNNCDLIVINTGHESRSSGVFLGAFAQDIVNHSKVPVLSFRHKEGHYILDTPGFAIE